jgi:hypothetical protein
MDGRLHVLNAGEEGPFIEHAMIDGDVETIAGHAEKAVEPRGFHPVPPSMVTFPH